MWLAVFFLMTHALPDVSDKVTQILCTRIIWRIHVHMFATEHVCSLADDAVWMQGKRVCLWPRWDCLSACQWAPVSLLCDYCKKWHKSALQPTGTDRQRERERGGGGGDIGGRITLETWCSQIILSMSVLCLFTCLLTSLMTSWAPPIHKHFNITSPGRPETFW